MLRYSLLSFFWKADSLSFNAHNVLERSAPVSIFSVPPFATASFNRLKTDTNSVAVSIYRLFMLILATMPCGLPLMAVFNLASVMKIFTPSSYRWVHAFSEEA